MDVAAPNAIRIFLPWDRPLLPQAVEFLAGGWDGDGPLDLSGHLVIVPTRQSGRRLREALAAFAHERGQAVFPPRVVTPEAWLMELAGPTAASRTDSLLAWTRVLAAARLADFDEVFPVAPPEQNFAWAWRVAREFTRLESTTAEGNLALGDITERAGAGFIEAARWAQLAELEQLYTSELEKVGKVSFRSALGQAGESFSDPDAIDRIILIGVPDPAAGAIRLLERWRGVRPIGVAIFAPESEAGSFDGWGRPRREAWGERELDLPDFEKRVHLRANPAAGADYIAQVAKLYTQPNGIVGIGVLDPALLAPVADGLRTVGLSAFSPEGTERRRGQFYNLLGSLISLGEDSAFARVRDLGRCPDFLDHVRRRLGEDFSVARWFAALDELEQRFLARDLEGARGRVPEMKAGADAGPALAIIAELRDRLRAGDYAESLRGALREIFSARNLDPANSADAVLRESAEVWAEFMEAFPPALLPREATRFEWWKLILELYAEGRQVEPKPAEALDLLGWLELLWEDAPHLLIGGGNDGFLPEPVPPDSFLPESFRERLGLTTNQSRLARDAYILQALVNCRREPGRVDIVYSKYSAEGHPLRPSRLLLQAADDALPARVNYLFGDPPASAARLAWRRAWPLTIPLLPPPVKVSATGLKRYMLCPFRFYLRDVLKLEAMDVGKTELDPREFGTLCHGVMEVAWRDESLRNSLDATQLREAYWAELQRRVTQRWGRKHNLPLVVQMESARQRLAAAATVEVGERAAGWRTREIEKKFSLKIAGVSVEGRIDRVDENELTGAWRVLDYKTSDTANLPEEAHLGARTSRPDAKDWAIYRMGKKEQAWLDLQLPLYIRACENLGAVAAGYFNLPKATTQTRISLWGNLSGEILVSANHCIDEACAAIAAGRFWPPNEKIPPEQDEFLSLFQHGVAASVVYPVAS